MVEVPRNAEAVTSYKQLLADLLQRRPSGTRQRLATALGKNRSFVTQVTNPAYSTPLPASDLEVLFEVCHFSASERSRFMERYLVAHPRKLSLVGNPKIRRPHTIYLPDLGDDDLNGRLQVLLTDFAGELALLMSEQPKKRKSR